MFHCNPVFLNFENVSEMTRVINIDILSLLLKGAYFYQLKYNGESYLKIRFDSEDPPKFKEVQIFASNPWYDPGDVKIRNFYAINTF